MAQAVRNPEVTLDALMRQHQISLDLSIADRELDLATVETSIKYEGYLTRQRQSVERNRRQEHRPIPGALPYHTVPGLSREVVQRFEQVRRKPSGRRCGFRRVTPAAVAVLAAYVERYRSDASSSAGADLRP